MIKCIFSTDLHGNKNKFENFFSFIIGNKPDIVFLGGDILPSGISLFSGKDVNTQFITEYFREKLLDIKNKLENNYPKIFVIMGNDDPKIYEEEFIKLEKESLLIYINQKIISYEKYKIAGYSYVPPTPFSLKDWEKYDVSRYIDPGCSLPEEGYRTIEIPENIIRYSTIEKDINSLIGETSTENLIFLFHSPPYKTNLDKINTRGRMIDYVKIDENVGSVAIKKFIESKQPLITLHGHIHESAQLTGKWYEYIGKTLCINASHQGKELSIVTINIDDIIKFDRILI